MARVKDQFQTIRSQGAVLPPDVLQRIASLDLDGLKPEDYHLPPTIRLNEEISQSWSRMLTFWKSFSDARLKIVDPDDTGAVITRERWMLPLFQELGYGRLTTEKSPEIEGKLYPIERFWKTIPIHIVGCNLSLDRRAKGVRGAATANPHSLVQEFLNRSDDHLWAFVTNGLQLRILRDNLALSRQSFVEFDLEAMMDGEVYADFALLWILCHQSRLEAEKPEDFWLEKWSKVAQEQGTRILTDLRDGVTRSIEALGTGFIAHRKNDALRRKLETGELSTQDYYRQLLRIVYRFLFLFVAEDRELLHPPDAEEKACALYDASYSTRYLRELAAKIRGSKHADLWHIFSLVSQSLTQPGGCPQLGLPGLGSFLWAADSTPDLLGPAQADGSPPVFIRNDDLLEAVRSLSFVERDKTLRDVDYRNLGSEELGSVYESLLELHPDINLQGRTFSLDTAAGNERKTTGSYYTPDSLVQCLLDSALDPVIDDRLQTARRDAKESGKPVQEAQEEALLNITVCDPAVGSGHFLIAAAHRLANRLASVRTGVTEPTPDDHQHALRDVIRRCVYGVDINPMAAELCKVSLWMESIDPGKPLSFLDAHIQVGNSLLGTTPALLAKGIPDDAFKPIEGDVKAVVIELKNQNKREHKDLKKGQNYLFQPSIKLGNLPAEFARLSSIDDDSVADVAEKERRYADLVSGTDYQNVRLLADMWCAVFVWKKDASDLGKLCPTERDFRSIETNPHSILANVKSEVRSLACEYQFFHWYLAFPEVFKLPAKDVAESHQTGWNGGFDLVLGNPPWDKIQPEEQQFFESSRPDIAGKTGAKRKKLINALATEDPLLYQLWLKYKRDIEAFVIAVKGSSMHELSCGGRLNTYSLFLETAWRICNPNDGFAGLIVQTGLVTDDSNKLLFGGLVQGHFLRSVYDFENKEGLFPGVHREQRFCLVTVGPRTDINTPITFAFWLTRIEQVNSSDSTFTLTSQDLRKMSPNTGACPTFKSIGEAEILRKMYSHGVLVNDSNTKATWPIKPTQFINVTSDSDDFISSRECISTECDYLPLYEGKLTHIYDHRYATFDVTASETELRTVKESEHRDSYFYVCPQYWLTRSDFKAHEESIEWNYSWFPTFHGIANPNNERTAIFTLVPRVPVGNSAPILIGDIDVITSSAVVAIGNSFAFDFATRRRIVNRNLNFFVLKQLPAPNPSILNETPLWSSDAFGIWIIKRVLELTYTAWDMKSYALDCGFAGPPIVWNEERRFVLMCELDAAVFHAYLGSRNAWGKENAKLRDLFSTPRDAVVYILETFTTVKRNDERSHGLYRTKDTILSIYDQMQQAIDTGKPYKTPLDPPPGPPTDKDGNFIPMSEWDPNNWPSHIHRPKEE